MTSFLAAFTASAWDTKSQRSVLVAGRPPPAELRQLGRVAPKLLAGLWEASPLARTLSSSLGSCPR